MFIQCITFSIDVDTHGNCFQVTLSTSGTLQTEDFGLAKVKMFLRRLRLARTTRTRSPAQVGRASRVVGLVLGCCGSAWRGEAEYGDVQYVDKFLQIHMGI